MTMGRVCRGSLGKLLAIGCSRGFHGVSGAKASGAKASGAKVSGAKVSGAKVSGAKVSGAKVSGRAKNEYS